MAEIIKVAVDAMGGDNAPQEIVKGATWALRDSENIKVVLVGLPDAIQKCLEGETYPKDRLEIKEATEVIEMEDSPTEALRQKKDSSMVVGIRMVKDGEVDAFVSAGNTGALLVGGQTIARPIKGIRRAALGTLIPTEDGLKLLIDAGANMDAKPEFLHQFAKMGSIYYENAVGVKNPRVALVNVGAEAEKGNALVKQTLPILEAEESINFVGFIETRDIPKGDSADIFVCDAFTGNVILKLYEGLSDTILHVLTGAFTSNLRSKLGAALSLPAIKKAMKEFKGEEYGAAPLLGLNGLIAKTHGNASAKEVHNSIIQCETFTALGIADKIKQGFLKPAANGEEK